MDLCGVHSTLQPDRSKLHQKCGRTTDWCLPSKMDENPLIWMFEVNGFLMDIRMAPREAQVVVFEKGLSPTKLLAAVPAEEVVAVEPVAVVLEEAEVGVDATDSASLVGGCGTGNLTRAKSSTPRTPSCAFVVSLSSTWPGTLTTTAVSAPAAVPVDATSISYRIGTTSPRKGGRFACPLPHLLDLSETCPRFSRTSRP